ncbi:MAG: molecular chaperone TorD family protein [Gammaproteobacteria bacterium]|nr:molecular chaperone TorD family protein [Gammaproteobacteria bacterium]
MANQHKDSDAGLEPQARADLYRFLAAAYLGPLAPEAVHCITGKDMLQELQHIFGARAAGALETLTAATGVASNVDTLRREYMDLFAVPSGRYVMPFEDIYRGGTAACKLGPLLGERAIAVRRLYREAGGEMDGDCKELPTHIGVELAFMGFLCDRESAAQRGTTGASGVGIPHPSFYRDLQRRFMRDHLNVWFPPLSQAIQRQASSPLYRGLAQLTEVVLEWDTAEAWALIGDQNLCGGSLAQVHAQGSP